MTASDFITGIKVNHAHHPKHGQITRLSWRGWQVDLDGLSVCVPLQDSTGTSIDDLATLLCAAYRMLRIPVVRRPSALAVLRRGLPTTLAAEVAQILRAAQAVADKHWDRRPFDIYACTKQSWQDAGMSVPYAALVTTLRAALPQPGSSLAEHNHTATAAAIHTLYDHAISLCRAGRPAAETSRIA
jgi:hypothetical protein